MRQFANVNSLMSKLKLKAKTPMGNLYGNSYVVDLRPTVVRLRVMYNKVDNKKNFVNTPFY